MKTKKQITKSCIDFLSNRANIQKFLKSLTKKNIIKYASENGIFCILDEDDTKTYMKMQKWEIIHHYFQCLEKRFNFQLGM